MENQSSQNFFIQQTSLPNATAVLVLGIISILGCFCYGVVGIICAIIALVLAKQDLVKYALDASLYTEASLKNLKAGRICAIVGLSLSVLYIIIIVIFLVFFGMDAINNPSQFYKH